DSGHGFVSEMTTLPTPFSRIKSYPRMPSEGRNFARIAGYGRIFRMVRGLTDLSHICHPHRRPARTRSGALAAAFLCATLGGCAGGVESVSGGSLWVQPGKYDFIKCPDIAQRITVVSAQEKNLMTLMAKADQEMAGPLINITVY